MSNILLENEIIVKNIITNLTDEKSKVAYLTLDDIKNESSNEIYEHTLTKSNIRSALRRLYSKKEIHRFQERKSNNSFGRMCYLVLNDTNKTLYEDKAFAKPLHTRTENLKMRSENE